MGLGLIEQARQVMWQGCMRQTPVGGKQELGCSCKAEQAHRRLVELEEVVDAGVPAVASQWQ